MRISPLNSDGRIDERPLSPRVLVAFPDSDVRDVNTLNIIDTYLTDKGYRVVTAATPDRAISVAEDYSLDAIVLSTQLVSSIPSFCEQIREIDRLLRIYSIAPHAALESVANLRNHGGVTKLSDLRDTTKINDALIQFEKRLEAIVAETRERRSREYDRLPSDHVLAIQRENRGGKASDELGEWMAYRYFRMPNPEGGFTGLWEDSAKGTVSAPIVALNPKKYYDPSSVVFTLKLLRSKRDYDTYVNDFRIHSQKEGIIRLAEPMQYHELDNGSVLALTRMYLAPTNAKAMKKLHQIGTAQAEQYVNAIVTVSLSKAAQWIQATRREVDTTPTALEHETQLYMKRVSEALRYSQTHYTSANSSQEAAAFESAFAASLEQIIIRHKELQVRIYDNSPYNSGLEIGKLDPQPEDVLAALSATGKRPKEAVESLFVTWDQYLDKNENGAIAPRHALEDFFHMVDAYEAGLSESKKTALYTEFMKEVLPQRARNWWSEDFNEYLPDFFIMGIYRNMRKHHLVVSSYAVNNEEQWKHFKIDNPDTHREKQLDYAAKAAHYANQAAKYAAVYAAFIAERKNFRGYSYRDNMSRITLMLERYESGTLDLRPAEESPLYIATRNLTTSRFEPQLHAMIA